MKEIENFVKKWCSPEEFNFDNIIKLDKEYYLVEPSLKLELDKIKLEPSSAGLFLGEYKRLFKPSIALMELIAPKTNKKVQVDDKSAWLFSCGRDIFDRNVDSKSDEFIVLNSKNDIFGWAKKKRDGKHIVYQNFLDIGDYLRREKNKR